LKPSDNISPIFVENSKLAAPSQAGSPTSRYRFLRVLHRIEEGMVVLLLAVMILMAVLQIFLRNAFSTSVIWGESLIRNLVLWIGLFGAMAASRDGNHIKIDIVTRFLPKTTVRIVETMVNLVTAGICLFVAYHSLRFVKMEMEYPTVAFGTIPTWACELIIPFAFVVIGLRYLRLAGVRLVETKETPRR
jgi:TRAP-type C4-dicarboxylate transport system permease small subunit